MKASLIQQLPTLKCDLYNLQRRMQGSSDVKSASHDLILMEAFSYMDQIRMLNNEERMLAAEMRWLQKTAGISILYQSRQSFIKDSDGLAMYEENASRKNHKQCTHYMQD